MLNPAFLPISLFTSVANRLLRGEAFAPRPVWYALMILMAHLITNVGDELTWANAACDGAWLLYFIGYAGVAWQAMFSACTGQAPGRKDAGYINWMQGLAYLLCGMKPYQQFPVTYTTGQWYCFGIVYGTIRAALMMPGVVALYYTYHSAMAFAGCASLLMGLVYYLSGVFSRWELKQSASGPTFAELIMGWWHGTFILIMAFA